MKFMHEKLMLRIDWIWQPASLHDVIGSAQVHWSGAAREQRTPMRSSTSYKKITTRRWILSPTSVRKLKSKLSIAALRRRASSLSSGPGRMLWSYDEPKGQFVLADGKHLYFYQPDQNQVIKSPLKNAFRGDIPFSFLLGLGNLKKDFNATLKAPTEIRSLAPRTQGRGQRIQGNSPRRRQDTPSISLGKRARCGE